MSMLFSSLTEHIASFLRSLNIGPEAYAYMFPPEIEFPRIQEMVKEGVFPTVEGLAPAFAYFILLSLARFILHYTVFKPLAMVSMQVHEVPQVRIADIDSRILLTAKDISVFCQHSGRKPYDVKKYLWTRKRNEVVHKKIVKYVEALWRCLFYLSFCVLGYQCLFVPETASWIVETMNHWRDWPLHPMSASLALYYHVELGCYFHQLFWTEVSRSDAVEMIAHHLITILLIVLSYLTNYTRIGASILFLHDLADIFLEAAKVLNYTSKPAAHRFLKSPVNIVDALFAVFALTFFVTRLVLYPRYILYSVIVEGVQTFGCEFGGCYVFIGLLCALQCLHIFWFYLILRMVVKLLTTGIEKDERSDDDEEEVMAELIDDEDNDADAADTTGSGQSKQQSKKKQ